MLSITHTVSQWYCIRSSAALLSRLPSILPFKATLLTASGCGLLLMISLIYCCCLKKRGPEQGRAIRRASVVDDRPSSRRKLLADNIISKDTTPLADRPSRDPGLLSDPSEPDSEMKPFIALNA